MHASPSWKGTTYLNGQLHPEGGETLLAALRAAMGGPPGKDDERTAAQRRADALTDIARYYLDTATTGTHGGARPHVTAVVDLPTVLGWRDRLQRDGRGGPAGPAGPANSGTRREGRPSRPSAAGGESDPAPDGATATGARRDSGRPDGEMAHDNSSSPGPEGSQPIPEQVWDGNGYGFGLTATLPLTGPISRQTALRLLCDCNISRLVTDGTSEVLDLGRAVRTATDAQKKALTWRDGGCVYPGCDQPPWNCDAHHTRHWTEHNGRTDLDGLALICRHHHTRLHEGGEILHHTEDGDLYLITTTGTRPAGRRIAVPRAP